MKYKTIDQCAMYGISEGCKGLDKRYRYNLTEKNIRRYRGTGIYCTSTDNRIKGFWAMAKGWKLLCTIYTGGSGRRWAV